MTTLSGPPLTPGVIHQEMKVLLIVSRIYVLLISAAGFLFGQLFFGIFDLTGTLTGFLGLLTGIFSGRKDTPNQRTRALLIIFCIGALIGAMKDASDYYTSYQAPGNDYAWELVAPFCIALGIILYKAVILDTKQQNVISNNV